MYIYTYIYKCCRDNNGAAIFFDWKRQCLGHTIVSYPTCFLRNAWLCKENDFHGSSKAWSFWKGPHKDATAGHHVVQRRRPAFSIFTWPNSCSMTMPLFSFIMLPAQIRKTVTLFKWFWPQAHPHNRHKRKHIWNAPSISGSGRFANFVATPPKQKLPMLEKIGKTEGKPSFIFFRGSLQSQPRSQLGLYLLKVQQKPSNFLTTQTTRRTRTTTGLNTRNQNQQRQKRTKRRRRRRWRRRRQKKDNENDRQ